ncbi:MAG TPA: ACT domain-containing protein, partial [Acidobacteriota bacterium]|nr:ACT domain-containing protein [Acidobacteriota bacterium]
MQNQLVMTVIGKDRTGLVESLAGLIADNHGNWLESRMCRLGGEFAGILRVQVPTKYADDLTQALRALHSSGLTVVVRPDEAVAAAVPSRSASLSVIGHDRPGIVYQISAALANHGINVEELESECYSAPMSGDMTFKATARLQIPESCILSDLHKELEAIGSELMVDISFKGV